MLPLRFKNVRQSSRTNLSVRYNMFARDPLPTIPSQSQLKQPVVIIDEQYSTDEEEDDAFMLVKIIYAVLFAVIECVCGIVTVFGIPNCTAGGIYQM